MVRKAARKVGAAQSMGGSNAGGESHGEAGEGDSIPHTRTVREHDTMPFQHADIACFDCKMHTYNM